MRPPHFWSAGLDPKSRAAAPLTRALLTPLAALYGWGVRRTIARAAPQAVEPLVICVGNLTVGGVGKTPVVQALRARLNGRCLRAASLSRGYGGREKGPLRVDPDTHTAANVGDEPLMLAQTGESWIGADRLAAAQAMAADGVEAIVMDDGYQNPALAKDLSVVVIDAAAPFGNGHLLPKGPLREPVDHGLSRAQAIILMGEGPIPAAVAASGLPVLRAKLAPAGPPPDGPLVAFAGIGRPEKFFDALAAAGADLSESVPFPDHHAFSPRDRSYLRDLAAARSARLITTEKDAARLDPEMRSAVDVFDVRAAFDDPAPLDGLIGRALETKS